MDIYKTRQTQRAFKPISRENFEQDTLRRHPWYQTNARGKEVQFAVCPACDNPIQIIGFYHLPANIQRPYGKHLAKGVSQLAGDNPEARENCPFFKPRPHRKTDRKQTLDGLPVKILELLISQFDRVIYLLRKQTGIAISRNLAEKMLRTYRNEQGYLYTGATLINVPWIFAYMADSQSLYHQLIADNTQLIAAVSRHVPAAEISDEGRVVSKTFPDGSKRFFMLDVCFIHHRQHRESEETGLVETMTMVISTENVGETVEIFKQRIAFDHHYFQNLVNLPDERAKRRPELNALAKAVLGDLIPNKA